MNQQSATAYADICERNEAVAFAVSNPFARIRQAIFRSKLDASRPEWERFVDDPRRLRAYFRRDGRGNSAESLAYLLFANGITVGRVTENQCIDLVESAIVYLVGQQSRSAAVTRAIVGEENAALTDAIDKRRKCRLRKYVCPECQQIARASTDELGAYHRHEDPDTGEFRFVEFELRTVVLDTVLFHARGEK